MDFDNQFFVSAPLDTAWSFMLDVEQVAPCVPGAQLTETLDDRHFRGTVKVKLGAVQVTYRGELEMEPDERARSVVLRAKGTETRGSGGASGTFTSALTQTPDGRTRVDIHSEVDVTGRVAQFGRSIMQDVANRLVGEFAACLETKIQTLQCVSDPSQGGTLPEQPAEAAASMPSPAGSPEASRPPDWRTRPAGSPISQSAAANEVKLAPLILYVLRSRTAALLRALADRVDPA